MSAPSRNSPADDRRSDQPADIDPRMGWGSDVAAQMLRRLGIPYISLNPGASYRGLHDSLVNHLGNRDPEIVMCLHEDHAVSMAHGYAKATGRAMAVALHSNVGLLHGSMSIFNAWCDRAPMLILGATGPVDATLRRPWIDWLHTASDQGALVRNFVKWDDQPGSAAAIPESILRAWQQTNTRPCGPVYVCLDAGIQEGAIEPFDLPDPKRFAPAPSPRPAKEAVAEAAKVLARGGKTVMLLGRRQRTLECWNRRVQLAERLNAGMLSDLKVGAMAPTEHLLHLCAPFNNLSGTAKKALREADVILSLDWIDLGGALQLASEAGPLKATVIHAGQDINLHNGFGKEHLALPALDVHLFGDADAAVEELLAALGTVPPRSEEHTSELQSH